MNFCDKVNEFFLLLSRSNKMADLILVKDYFKDDHIKSIVDKEAKHL